MSKYNESRIPLNSPFKTKKEEHMNPSTRNIKPADWKPKIKDDWTWQPPNAIFRRFANGQLCYDSALAKIFEALMNLKNKGPLNEVETAALSLVVPGLEDMMNKDMARTMVRISDDEKAKLRVLFAAETSEMANWNAGLGGGSTNGRTITTA